MTSYDFDISLKYIFVGLHVLFIAGAAFYIAAGQNDFATFFGISSVLALLYYVMYQTGHLQTRMQAHLNLIEQAVKNSEEFREEVEVKSEQGEGATPDLGDILMEKSVAEVKEFVQETLEDEEKLESYGGRNEFLESLKEAEEQGQDRVTIKYRVTELMLDDSEEDE